MLLQMLYGARGANGVILITTKRKVRDSRVTFDAKWGVNKRAVPSYETVTDPGKFYEMSLYFYLQRRFK